MSIEILEQKINQLTPEEQEQVLKFVENFLNKKNTDSAQHTPQFKWAGGLANLKDKYTSIELQKKIIEWW